MGLVIRPSGTGWVRKDNFQFIPNERVKQIPKEERVSRFAINLLVYSDFDFNEFYVKHVLREAKGEYTVLLRDDGEIPTVNEIRKLMEGVLKEERLNLKEDPIFIKLPNGYHNKVWNAYLKKFINKPTKNTFVFRDITPLTKIGFQDMATKLGKNEYNNLVALWEESFTDKVEYCINGGKVYFIGKIMVV